MQFIQTNTGYCLIMVYNQKFYRRHHACGLNFMPPNKRPGAYFMYHLIKLLCLLLSATQPDSHVIVELCIEVFHQSDGMGISPVG